MVTSFFPKPILLLFKLHSFIYIIVVLIKKRDRQAVFLMKDRQAVGL